MRAAATFCILSESQVILGNRLMCCRYGWLDLWRCQHLQPAIETDSTAICGSQFKLHLAPHQLTYFTSRSGVRSLFMQESLILPHQMQLKNPPWANSVPRQKCMLWLKHAVWNMLYGFRAEDGHEQWTRRRPWTMSCIFPTYYQGGEHKSAVATQLLKCNLDLKVT